jgi:type I restriction enzyme, S subunit
MSFWRELVMSLLESELSRGRRWIRLGDLYEVTRKPRGLDVSTFPSIPFIPMESIPQGGEFEPRFVEKAPEAISSGTYFERDDILVAKITPSFENGKQALPEQLPFAFGYATTEVIPLRPKVQGQDRRLMFFYLLHPDIRSFVAEKMEGATGRQRIPENVLLDLPFPEIPHNEQTTIANSLLLVQQAIKAEDLCIAKTILLKRAALREVFTRGLHKEPQKETEIGLMPESWQVVRLGELGRIGNGSTPKKTVPSYWDGGTYPWLTSAKVYDREIVAADQFVTQQALDECHLPRIKPGAVLIAITGQGKTLGHCAVLRIEASTNQHIAYLATDTQRADPSFLRGYLETQYDYLRQIASGGGSTKGALTCAFLRDLLVPLPLLLEEQREIVAILDAIDHKVDIHKRKRVKLEDLFRTMLHKLIVGEIGVSDLDLSQLVDRDIPKENPE